MSTAVKNRVPLAAIFAVSAAACAFLFWLIYFREATGGSTGETILPAINAALNGGAAVSLVLGLRAVKNGDQDLHKKLMMVAFAFSAAFLVGYIIHHALHGDSKFIGEGPVRGVYFFVLISHIVLSIPALPMVLITFYFSLTDQISKHRRLAKFTFPIWLYVSVTGVLVFAMLKTLSG